MVEAMLVGRPGCDVLSKMTILPTGYCNSISSSSSSSSSSAGT